MSNLHTIDTMLQRQFPTLMVPTRTKLDDLESNGHRFLMSKTGVWIEVKRAWLHTVVQLARQEHVSMPYGELSSSASIQAIPMTLIKAFQLFAKDQLPNECAARILLNTETQAMRLETFEPLSVGAGHVNFNIPPLPPEEVLVVDLHSHGLFDTFFSSQDDEDDKGEVKVAGVVSFKNQPAKEINHEGRCNIQFRLCLNGAYKNLHGLIKNNELVLSIEE